MEPPAMKSMYEKDSNITGDYGDDNRRCAISSNKKKMFLTSKMMYKTHRIK